MSAKEEAAAANAEVTRLHGELADARRASANTIREAYKVPMLTAEIEQLHATIARVRQMVDAWEQQFPETIRTAAAVDAIRMATERYALDQPDDQSKGT